MSVFDRFTRDEVSQWVWWPAAMVLVVLVVLTFPGQNRAIGERRNDAAARAWSLATGAIAPTLDGARSGAIQEPASARMAQLAAAQLLASPWTETVRIWADDSTLLWSSDPAEPVGSAGGLNDEEITRALADLTRADQVVRERDLDGRPSEPTFSAYAPFTFGGAIAAAEFEVTEATLLGDVKADWLGYRIVLGIAAAFVLALALGSMREPIARIGAGVPFVEASLPPDTEIISIDRKLELEHTGAAARGRVATMEARLQESEEQRLRAEGELQRALSRLATAGDRPTRSVIPRPAAAQPAAPAPAPATPAVSLPPVSVPPAASLPPAAAPAVKTDRSPSGRRRSTPRSSEPAARRSVADRDGGGLVVVPEASPRTVPEPSLDGRRTAGSYAAAAVAPARVAADAPSTRERIVVPEASAVVERDEAEAREVLERLVEPVARSVAPAPDAGALRAALARTAARKKPGARHDERLADTTDR